MQNLHLDSELAADLARKINNGERLSWEEAKNFKYRVTSKMGEIQAYLERESRRAALEGVNLDPARGWKNDFSIRLAEIKKLQESIANKKDFIDKIETTTGHEREETLKLAQEGIAKFTGETITRSTLPATKPAWSPASGVNQGENVNISPDSRAAGLKQAAKMKVSVPNDIEINAIAYNSDFKNKHSAEFASILDALKLNTKLTDISRALETFLKKDGATYTHALELQKVILKFSSSDIGFSIANSKAKGGPDGFFGPISLAALQNVVGIEVPSGMTSVQSATPGILSASRDNPKALVWSLVTPRALVYNQAAPAVTTFSTPISPVLSSAPSNTSYGLSLQNGRVWVLGAKWERHELKTSMLPELGHVDNTKFKSAVSFMQDAGLLLESMATYAVSHNWKSKDEYAKHVIAYGDFISKLTETDPVKVKGLVAKYIDGVISPTSEIGGDIRRLWLMDTSILDTDRSARVVSYVRKDLEAYEKVWQMRAA
jgi:hypothetical protein